MRLVKNCRLEFAFRCSVWGGCGDFRRIDLAYGAMSSLD